MKLLGPMLIAVAMTALPPPAKAQSIDPKVMARIDRILKRTPLIDGHNDLPWEIRKSKRAPLDVDAYDRWRARASAFRTCAIVRCATRGVGGARSGRSLGTW